MRQPVFLRLTTRSQSLPVLVDLHRIKCVETQLGGGSIVYLRGMAPIIVAEALADITDLYSDRVEDIDKDSVSLARRKAGRAAGAGLPVSDGGDLVGLIWVVHHVDENSAAGAFASEQGAIDHLAESGQTPDQDEPLWYERLEVFP